jgi:3',5'-cyclic AMP phosphodiesterase CpdA
VPTRVLHLSDLHFGRAQSPALHEALRRLTDELEPELVVASGDLAHRGRGHELDAAAQLLRSLDRPLLVVPGNHDIPLALPARFTRPWAEFERVWGTTRPVYRSDTLCVVGLNSARPWRHQSGRVTSAQLDDAIRHFREAPAGAVRVAVLHHQMLGAPWRSRKRPVAARNRVLARLVESGAELVLAGHIHQSTVAERREFEVSAPGGGRTVVVSVAPGLGQPRPRRRGEACGLQVYDVTDAELSVSTHVWNGEEWDLAASRTFPRGRAPVAPEPSEHRRAATTL